MSYYPVEIELKTLPNKLYLLTWKQNNHTKQKLLTKAMAIKFVNDNNHYKGLRECVLKHFEKGDIK